MYRPVWIGDAEGRGHEPPYAVFFIVTTMALLPSVMRCLRLQIACESCLGSDVEARGRSGLEGE
jgi:hypothetical protein